MSSRTFRIGFFDGDRYRFFASCCVIVLPPRANSMRSMLISIDSFNSSKSMPSCFQNALVLGHEHGAREIRGDAPVRDPALDPLRRLAARARLLRAQLDERRGVRVAKLAGYVRPAR